MKLFFVAVLLLLVFAGMSFSATSLTNCSVITSPGVYQMSNDFTGAPNPVGPFNGVCVAIQSSGVVFDCNGYSVTDDGLTIPMTVGILAYGNYQNVTIENCPSVSNYTYGVGLDYADNSIIRNVTAHDNHDAGIYIARSGNNNLVINCTSYGHTDTSGFAEDGFYMYSGSNNRFVDNIAYDNVYGFDIRSGASTTNLTNNIAYNNTQHGFRLYQSSGNQLNGNTANHSSAGFHLEDASSNTFANNTAMHNSYGFYLIDGSDSNTFTDNVAYLNSWYGFNIFHSSGNTLNGNTAHSQKVLGSNRGFYLFNGANNNLTDNEAYNNTLGFYLESDSDGNTLTGNTAYSNTDHGFYLDDSSSDNTLTGNTAYSNTDYGFYLYQNANGNTLTSNTAHDNNYGFALSSSSNNTLTNNTAYSNNQTGFHVISATNNNFTRNKAYGQNITGVIIRAGFNLISSSDNIFTDNLLWNNAYAGFYVYQNSDDTNISHNNISNSSIGVYILDSDDAVIASNNITDVSTGVFMENSVDTIAFDNTLNNCSTSGYFMQFTDGISISDSTINKAHIGVGFNAGNNSLITGLEVDNSGYPSSKGFSVSNSNNVTISHSHVYNASLRAFDVDAPFGPTTITLTNVTVDSPPGLYQNFTTFNLQDLVSGGTNYGIKWSAIPSALPYKRYTFADKYLSIVSSGAVSLDSIEFTWTDAEVSAGGYNESKFELWKYNGTWSNMNATLNTSANTLGLTGLDPSSIFAILYIVDTDGDGVPDDEDACPYTEGYPEWDGCPYANEVEVKLHIVDVAGIGACPGPGNSCWEHLEEVGIKVYDRNDPNFTAMWTSHPDSEDYPNIFGNEVGLVGSCTTNASGVCIAGEVAPGEYLLLGKYYDASTNKTVFVSAYKAPDDFVEGLATKDLQFMKQIKKEGQIDYKPVSQVFVEDESVTEEGPGKGKGGGKPAKTEEPSMGLVFIALAVLGLIALFVWRGKQ